ncbi:MAG: DNA polymerase III subunit alpha [Flavobacteriales bacterium]|nr:DNA polymerase III subunit alpha [Flavobacteriales bacterium]
MRYGTIKPELLLQLAEAKGVKSLVLTDINSTSACLEFVRLSEKYEVKPILGIDFRNGVDQLFVAIAKNNDGFQEINTYLSHYLHSKEEIPPQAPDFKNAYIIYPLSKYAGQRLKSHEFIGVDIKEVQRLKFKKGPKEKMVIQQPVSFQSKRGFNAHRLLRAIDNNTLLSTLPRSEEGKVHHMMHEVSELLEVYQDFPDIIANTEQILDSCEIHFDFSEDRPHQNIKTFGNSPEQDYDLLCKLCKKGLEYRYPNANQKIYDRLEKELYIIKEMGFISYFLVCWDLLRYARDQGYYYVGRGSGANSIVAYLLRITDVDPVELDLYFERFINLFRKNPPDFDIDFSWKDRDDVTRYLFDKYKYDHVTLLATYSTFQYRATIREMGKVFGLPKHEIDVLASGNYQLHNLDKISTLVLKYAAFIKGLPNHLSIHAGGILISEKPIHYFTATSLPPKDFPITHFDMHIAEDVGLYKFDILSQRGLGKIKETLEVISYNKPNDSVVDIHNISYFKQDERIKELLREAKAIGCFYVESPAMRMLLKKLRADDYLGLVAASSIIRPGVAKSGMMREYILRFRMPERRNDAHPVLQDLMPETFGIMVYQEDVIKVAHYFAGLTLGEADMLRRGMSGKFRSREEFQKVKQKFFDNCNEKGYKPELTADVWRQIESFAGYAFAKGHSASYAVESYQSLYLKAYYPLEYMVATINNYGGFYRTELYVHEARMHGAEIHLPCINKSDYYTKIFGNEIFIGFHLIDSLETNVAQYVVEERMENGQYKDFDDFLDRVPIGIEQIVLLVRANAFRFTGKNKRELLWETHFKVKKEKKATHFVLDLFKVRRKNYKLPALEYSDVEDLFDEMELIGFPLSNNPFSILRDEITNEVRVEELPRYLGKRVCCYGYLVTTKNTSTSKGERMHFGTFLDRDGAFLDTVHFPDVAKKYAFRGKGVYQIWGKVMEEFDCYNIEVDQMYRMAYIEDPRYSEVKTANKRAS